jgi:hypothetical protein
MGSRHLPLTRVEQVKVGGRLGSGSRAGAYHPPGGGGSPAAARSERRRRGGVITVAWIEPTGPSRSGRPDDRLHEIREKKSSTAELSRRLKPRQFRLELKAQLRAFWRLIPSRRASRVALPRKRERKCDRHRYRNFPLDIGPPFRYKPPILLTKGRLLEASLKTERVRRLRADLHSAPGRLCASCLPAL